MVKRDMYLNTSKIITAAPKLKIGGASSAWQCGIFHMGCFIARSGLGLGDLLTSTTYQGDQSSQQVGHWRQVLYG